MLLGALHGALLGVLLCVLLGVLLGVCAFAESRDRSAAAFVVMTMA